MTLFEHSCKRHAENGTLDALGFHLDDVSQWDDVIAIPENARMLVKSLFEEGFDQHYAAQEVIREHGNQFKWVAEFMAMYHESYC